MKNPVRRPAIGMAGEGTPLNWRPSADAVAGERAGPLDQPPTVPTVRLPMDVGTFVCLGYGR